MLITCYSHSALPLNFALIYSVLQCRCILFKELGSHSVVQLAGTHHCPYQHRHSIGRLRHRVLTGISRFKIWNFSFAEKSQILRFFPPTSISKSEIFIFLSFFNHLKIWDFSFSEIAQNLKFYFFFIFF